MRAQMALARMFAKNPSQMMRYGFVNGLPGFVTRESDNELQTTGLQIEDGRIVAIYVMRNPDKLQRVGGHRSLTLSGFGPSCRADGGCACNHDTARIDGPLGTCDYLMLSHSIEQGELIQPDTTNRMNSTAGQKAAVDETGGFQTTDLE